MDPWSYANDPAKHNKFYTSMDDSSDEEDSVEQYDIKEEIKELKQIYHRDCYHYSLNDILSFIGHAVGISILYSPVVQRRYYQLKEEKLQQDPRTVQFLNDEIRGNMEWGLERVWQGAGNDWKIDANNMSIIRAVFQAIRNILIPGILNDQMGYCRNYRKGPHYHLEPLFNNGLDPYLIPYFRSNFSFPFPLKNFTRKTLESVEAVVEFDLSEVGPEHFSLEFLANLRLHNRSEKRHTLNREQCRDTRWVIFLTEVEEVVISLNNQRNQICNEKNEPLYYRNEQVYLGRDKWATYSKFFSCQTKIEFSILLKNRLNIKKGLDGMSLSENIMALWYLLFGCEVIKNPAAIIHNNMVLDLAEELYVDEESQLGYDYEQIIADIPMSEKGSIKQAMELNKRYGYLMPYNYRYYANYFDSHAFELIDREGNITKKWLELKLGKAAARYLITQCEFDNKAVETIWEVIAESFERWGI